MSLPQVLLYVVHAPLEALSIGWLQWLKPDIEEKPEQNRSVSTWTERDWLLPEGTSVSGAETGCFPLWGQMCLLFGNGYQQRKGWTVEKGWAAWWGPVKVPCISSSSALRSHVPTLNYGQGTVTNPYTWRSWDWMGTPHAELTSQTLVGKCGERPGWEMALTWQVLS